MPVGIPLRSDLTFFDLVIPLDAVNYTLQFRWNLREGAWYMDVLDDTGTTILMAGIKLVVDYALGIQFADRSPPGFFMMLDTSGKGDDPGISDLGARCKLIYWTAADLAAFLA